MTVKQNARQLLGIADLVVCVAIGLGLFLGSAVLALDRWHVMPPSFARQAHIHHFLKHELPRQPPAVLFLGSSVFVEGVDCAVVEAALPGERCCNLGWTGGSANQWLMLVDQLRAARPRAVVLGVDLIGLADFRAIPEERLRIARQEGALAADFAERFAAVLSERERAVSAEWPVQVLLGLRNLPAGALDAFIRETARSDMRYASYATNLRDPWNRRSRVPPQGFEILITHWRSMFAEVRAERVSAWMKAIDTVIGEIAGPPIFVVITPLHVELLQGEATELLPRVRAQLAACVARRAGAELHDHSSLIADEHFYDPSHPGGPGRELWSQALGRMLAARLKSEP